MIAMLLVLSNIFIHQLASETNNILVSNYNTLDYARLMQIALNEDISKKESQTLFENNLNKQLQNITEIGEKELTEKLVSDYHLLKQNKRDALLDKNIRADISDIMLLNMQSIQRKSMLAKNTAHDATLWIALTGTICFIISFTLLVNLPSNIANPIKELTKSIQQIASQNYAQRLHFEKHNEFGDLAAAFNTMAEKLQEFKDGNLEKLMIEKKRIETLINNMHDPVIGLDENKHILFMNDMALKVTSLKREEVVGVLVQDIAVRNDLIRTLIQDLFTETEILVENNKEIIKIYADNKESYFEKEIIPIKIFPTGENEEKLIGNVILLQNVTTFKALDFAKTNFIANVSHELKTPIAAIKLSIQLLENGQIGLLNHEQLNLLDSIKDDANRLLKITSELLNMTQLESGNIQLSILPSDIKEILQYAANATKTQAEQKKITFKIESPATISNLLIDSEKTAWVLTNLISNAIRYSYENSVINLTINEHKNKVIVSVRDSGQGIAPQYKDRIFERYFQIPSSKKEGTGLGLAISKEFMEAQGGQILVESEIGVGSTFSLVLNKSIG
jgi:two-component system, NtrC family, sensor histidine kinase KinB